MFYCLHKLLIALAASLRTAANTHVYANIPSIFGCEHKVVRRIALLAPIKDDASAESCPSTHDLQLWAVYAYLPPHYLYDTLPPFFVAQVRDVRLLPLISYQISYATRPEALYDASATAPWTFW
jgi:hypothetical protein